MWELIKSLDLKMEFKLYRGLGIHSVSQIFLCRAYSRINFGSLKVNLELRVFLALFTRIIHWSSWEYVAVILR